jgi:hypothetical protein
MVACCAIRHPKKQENPENVKKQERELAMRGAIVRSLKPSTQGLGFIIPSLQNEIQITDYQAFQGILH